MGHWESILTSLSVIELRDTFSIRMEQQDEFRHPMIFVNFLHCQIPLRGLLLFVLLLALTLTTTMETKGISLFSPLKIGERSSRRGMFFLFFFPSHLRVLHNFHCLLHSLPVLLQIKQSYTTEKFR